MDLVDLNSNLTFLENSLKSWIGFGLILVLGFIFSGLFARFFSWIAYRLFRKFSHGKYFDQFHQLLRTPFLNLIHLSILYAAFYQLHFPDAWNFVSVKEFGVRWLLQALFMIVFIIAWMRVIKRSIDFMEYVYTHKEDSPVSPDLATFLRRLFQILLYVLGAFTILGKVFEVNITAIVTSLGIGGLAIALAAQDTLANLIGSFIIYLDRPFQVGDTIQLGDVSGIVEKIGFRTIRIRTLDRSLLIVPNKKIVDSNLNNITQSQQRRVRIVLNLTYQSKKDQIVGLRDAIAKRILEAGPLVSQEVTVRFIDFDTSSLNLLIIYFVNTNEYEVMAEVKEKLNLQIMDEVELHGCQFAYPTQTVFVKN